MKKIFLVVFVFSLFSSNASAGGIPVFDGVANTTDLKHWAEKLQQWQETVLHYQNQITLAKDQLDTLRGIKDHVKNFNINALLNDINAIDSLIPSYDSIVNGKWNTQSEALANKLGINDKCDNGVKKISNLCKSEGMNLATNYIVTNEVNKRVNKITKDIQKLSREVATSNDVKTTADVNNKIGIYNGQLETLDRKLTIAQRQYEMNKELIRVQRENEIKELNLQPTSEYFGRFQNLLKSKNSNKRSDGF